VAFNKSGVSVKKGLDIGASVVDETYTGECHLSLVNTTADDVFIAEGEKIVQFILLPIGNHTPTEVSADELHPVETARGAGGFGSTGVH
jgi:dUTP pyrophosphatase